VFFVGAIAFLALLVAIAAWKRASDAHDKLDALLFAQRHAAPPAPVVPKPPVPVPAPVPVPEPQAAKIPTPHPPAPASAPAPAPEPPPHPTTPPRTTAPPPRPTPPPPPPPRATVPPPPPPTPSKPFDWEALIGVKLFSWIGGIALVLAAIFFLSYSVQHGWIKPWLRASIGLATGTALIAVCEMRLARGYKWTADALDGAGIAILYATLYASHALWHLASAAVIFGAMLVVTAVAVALSIRRDSVFIALLGLLGGFATPALLSTGENKPIPLFAYLLLLNIGLAWVAMTKRWPLLTGLTVVLTIVYEWTWLAKFLTVSQLPLAAMIFATFGLAATATLFFSRRDDAAQPRFDISAVAGACLPLLFAVFGAAVPAYGARYGILFGFLLLVTAALAVISRFREPRWLYLVGGAATIIVLVIWTAVSYTPAAWPAIVAWLAVFTVVQLAAAWPSRATLAPGVLLLFPILVYLEPRTASPWLLFGTLFVLLALVAAYALRHRAGIAYFAAALLALFAEAMWSAKYLAPERLVSALALYAVFALFFAGVPVLARRLGREIEPQAATPLLLIVAIGLLFFIAGGSTSSTALWGLAVLLAITNAGTFIEARVKQSAVVAILAGFLSWIVIAVWLTLSINTVTLIPALIVAGGFGLFSIAGTLWTRDQSGDAIFLVIFAYVFLAVIAGQTSLSIPPWPMFAVLLVLDLAIGAAAIYLKRMELLLPALAASQIVLIVFAAVARDASWPLVAMIAALAVAALGIVWDRIDRRFAPAALVAILLGHAVAIVAGDTSLFARGATHMLLIAALLAITPWPELANISVAAAAFATALAPTHTPAQQFLFALPFYLIFAAAPFVGGSDIAAVLASGAFFVFARRAMLGANLGYMIGILPVAEAAVLLVLVWRLRRAKADLTKLAVVAGAALAFITAAIPLQFEKHWITIGWALEAAALLWLFRRVPHKGLLIWAGALFAAVFVRLVFNPAIFLYQPGIHLYTYAVCAAAFLLGAKLRGGTFRAVLASCGTVLLFFVLNIEIADYYAHGAAVTFNFFSSSLAQDLTYTIGWAIFAVALLIAGIALHSRGARLAAIVMLLATIFKCFLHDLGRLGGLYRVGSLLGLAISIVLVAVLLQRFVTRPAPTAAPAEETT
jgi:uncharacterized membrane protein